MQSSLTDHLDDMIRLFQSHLQHIRIRECTRWSNLGWFTPDPIYSDDLEISYMESGTRQFQYTDGLEIHHTGDIVFMDCAREAICKPGEFRYSSVIIAVDQSTPESRDAYRRLQQHFHALRCIPSHFIQSDFLALSFKEMFQEFVMKANHEQLRIKLQTLQILIELQRRLAAPTDTPRFPRRYQALVSEVITYLSENLDTTISLEEIGARFKLNPRHLNRIFKQVTGTPIKRYQYELKMDKAKKLLRTSSLNLLEIALELGFQSSQYLNYYFKNATGITPNDYRRHYQ